jgi:hypothetical protein
MVFNCLCATSCNALTSTMEQTNKQTNMSLWVQGLVHHVTLGARAPRMGKRKVGSPGHVGLHVDLTDVVALLCVRQNPDNPLSHAASTLTLYNEIRAKHPHLLPLLQKGVPWFVTPDGARLSTVWVVEMPRCVCVWGGGGGGPRTQF